MWRDCLALVVAFAVTVFGLSPQLSAQEQFPANGSDPNAGYGQPPQPQYPAGAGGGWPSSSPQAPPNAGGPDQNDAIDPAVAAQHGVARLSVVQGDVNIKRSDTGELVAGAVNAPIVGTDRVQTGPGSRAELELDYANLLRVGPDTDVGFANLERHRFQVQLGAGTVISRVIRSGASTVEIDTPSIAVHPIAEGVYRISVGLDGTTQIAVRVGTAEVYSPRGTQQLSAGQTISVRGDPSNPEFLDGTPVEQDQFEDWSINRDRTLLQAQNNPNVNPQMEGTGDLDSYGSWVPSQYGQVWAPRPPSPDWSPYSDGHWAYVDDYYGWSWVGAEPWGWAPYHYGRWFWNGGYGWSWWPGPVAGAGLFWSPALVGFFGFGLGLAAGIGWAALAPFELFHPWWGHGLGWGHGFGLGRGGYGFAGFRGNVAGMYRNAGFRGGAITASYNQFGSHFGRFSSATREQLANATSFRGGIPMRPTQASYRFSNRSAVGNPRLNAVSNRSFFTAHQGFTRAGAGGGQNFGGAGRTTFAQSSAPQHGVAPNMSAGRSNTGSTAQQRSNGGWQHFGNPGSNSYRQNNLAGSSGQQGGWHSFGRAESPGGNTGKQQQQPYAGSTYGGSRSAYAGSNSRVTPGRNSAPQSTPRYGGTTYGGGAYGGNAYRNSAPSQPRSSSGYGGGSSAYGGGSGYRGGATGPSYRGGAAQTPHYSQPSYGGGSSHSFGGGGGSPHYGGGSSGGGSHSGGGFSGGGGHSSGGGGGHSGGGGGGHSGGGGGGHHR